jgi:transcriptional regulator with XRE-family HTH domain
MQCHNDSSATHSASATHLATTLRELRLAAGLSKHEVVAAMGYRNANKGLSRLAAWESGRDFPREDRPQLLVQALGCSPAQLLDPLEQHLEAQRALNAANAELLGTEKRALETNRRWLAEHYELLCSHRAQILAWPAWRDTVVLGASGSASFIGGRSFRLGELLTGWLNDSLFVEHEQGPLLIVGFSGSPLSGSHRVCGFFPHTKEWYSGNLPTNYRFGPFAKGVLDQPQSKQASDWSLGDILGALGATLDQATITDASGGLAWRYDYGTRRLIPPTGDCIQLNPRPTDVPVLREVHTTQGLGFRVSDGQIQPGRWDGTRCSDPHNRWTARPTRLWVKRQLAFYWDRILPASAVANLATQ